MNNKNILIGFGALILIVYLYVTFGSLESPNFQSESVKERTNNLKKKNALKQLERLESDGTAFWTKEERGKLLDEYDKTTEGLTGELKEIMEVGLKVQREMSEYADRHNALTQKFIKDGGMFDPEQLPTIEAIDLRLKSVKHFKESSEVFLEHIKNMPSLLKRRMLNIKINEATRVAGIKNFREMFQFDKQVMLKEYDVEISQTCIEILTFLKENFGQWEYSDSQMILATDEMVQFYNKKTTLLEETGAKQDALIRDVLETELKRQK